jgi:hypothetical protein
MTQMEIDEAEFQALATKIAEPIRNYLRMLPIDPRRPLTALNVLAEMAGVVLVGTPQEHHDKVRAWFDNAVNEAIKQRKQRNGDDA